MPPPKTCRRCGRVIEWRKKWAQDWDQLQFCSNACRKIRMQPIDLRLEQAIVELLTGRARSASICPSEAARLVAAEAWQPLMETVRQAARRLAARQEVEITQQGQIVDPSTAKGPIRIRRGSRFGESDAPDA